MQSSHGEGMQLTGVVHSVVALHGRLHVEVHNYLGRPNM